MKLKNLKNLEGTRSRFEPKSGEPWFLTKARTRSYISSLVTKEEPKIIKKWYKPWTWIH